MAVQSKFLRLFLVSVFFLPCLTSCKNGLNSFPSFPTPSVSRTEAPSGPVNVTDMVSQGYKLLDQKQFDQAMQMGQNIIAKDSKNGNGYNILGLAAFGLGQADKAIDAFKKILQLDPKAGYAHRSLGYVYLTQKKWTIADQEFRLAIKQKPDFWGYRGLGDNFIKQGKKKEAAKAYEQALKYPEGGPTREEVEKELSSLLSK